MTDLVLELEVPVGDTAMILDIQRRGEGGERIGWYGLEREGTRPQDLSFTSQPRESIALEDALQDI